MESPSSDVYGLPPVVGLLLALWPTQECSLPVCFGNRQARAVDVSCMRAVRTKDHGLRYTLYTLAPWNPIDMTRNVCARLHIKQSF